MLVNRSILKLSNRCKSRSNSYRVTIVGSGEDYAATWRKAIHELALADQRCNRIPVGHCLGKGAQIGCHIADLLISSKTVAKAGDHLVKDQHNAVLPAQVAQTPQELRLWQDTTDVVRDHFN